MESIKVDQLIELKSDTILFVRKQYDLDKPERLDEAILILKDWLNKQDHFVRKDYSKEYLERIIIHSKGSVERAKMKLEKTATYRTLLPQFFEPLADVIKTRILDDVIVGIVPKLTENHYRVFMMKVVAKQFGNTGFLDFYRYMVMLCEYLLAQDYSNGLLAVLDYSEAHIFEIIKAVNVMEMHQVLRIIVDGFGMRIKGIHFITTSRAIDNLIILFKQALSAKVAERIQVHNSVDGLYTYIPKEILPIDYGGQANSLPKLHCDLKATLGSENNMNYFKEMQNACTNENFRREDKFNEQYLGVPGTFRKLNVD